MATRISGVAVAVVFVLAAAACGDNSRICGPNTIDKNGVCSGTGGGICGDGTRLNPDTGECEPDPSLCPAGTVLVDGHCVDGSTVTVDLEEGPEPNGFEVGAVPAGIITLEPAGMGFTLHGCIQPKDNTTPDLDVYLLQVAAPTLIKITADGVNELAAGFVAIGDPDVPAVAGYQRFGLNIATDTSRRELYLPTAGTYAIVMADTRSLLPVVDGSNTFPPAGNPDGTSCYFTTIEQRTVTPASFDIATGATGTIGEDLKFYAPTGLPNGFISMTGTIASDSAAAALIVTDNGALRVIADGSPTATAFFGGIRTGDQPVVVLDYVFDYALFPATYSLKVDFTTTSQALPVNGGTINAISKGQSFGGNFDRINLFHWDVDEIDHADGFDLRVLDAAATGPFQVQGVAADQNGVIIANLTGLGGSAASSTTFDHYTGMLRAATPGRYYFVVFAPRNPVGTAFKIKSTITPLVSEAIQLDTPTPPIAINASSSNPLLYNAGGEPWQLFDATGNNTGNLTARFFARSTSGRFDDLTVRQGPNPGTVNVLASDVPALFQFVFPPAGSPKGRILRNETAATPPAPTDFFIHVRPTILTGANRTFTLGATTREYHDFANLTAATTTVVSDEPLEPGTPKRRYFLATTPGNLVTLTVTPNTATLDPVISTLHVDESIDRNVNANPAARAETVTFAQGASGFTAFDIHAVGAVTATNRFTLTVKIDPPFYSVTSTATPFVDACAGGVVRPVAPGGNDDEGMTAAIALPAGFTYYGKAVSSFKIATNGYLTFDTSVIDSSFTVTPLPDGVGDINIAPAWDDLANVVMCTKLVGGKLVVQWTGDEFFVGTHAQFQAILDPANDSIEFVYGPEHVATGDAAVAGVQDRTGSEATQIGAFSEFIVPGTSKKLTHP